MQKESEDELRPNFSFSCLKPTKPNLNYTALNRTYVMHNMYKQLRKNFVVINFGFKAKPLYLFA